MHIGVHLIKVHGGLIPAHNSNPRADQINFRYCREPIYEMNDGLTAVWRVL
jgi:hypothetical protein